MKTSFDVLNKGYSQFRSDLGAARGMLLLVSDLRKFLRERITPEQAEEEIKRAVESRQENFLELLRTKVYERPSSPYLKLLKIAGCEYSDLRTEVLRYGVEAALRRLAGEGVYLTSDEFKGKKEVARGGQSFRVYPKDFARQDSAGGFVTESSGTRNQPVRSFGSLDWLTVRAPAIGIFLSAHNLLSDRHAVYEPILPTGTGINNLLYNAKLGIKTDRWFSPKVVARSWLRGRYYHFTTNLIVLTGRFSGHALPSPEFVEVGDLRCVVLWVLTQRRMGRSCSIKTTASAAARIAGVALDIGVSLKGTTFISGGEPFTDSKRERIEEAGARAIPRYAHGGGLSAGFGCANPQYTDEVHVNASVLALISHPSPLVQEGPPIHPLLFTTLHRTAPTLLLNVENGDYATLMQRNCGCALERVGFKLHLRGIRSFEKFASEAMNYFYGDLFEFLEKTIPSEFGGGPGEYQLVEEEDNKGQTRLSLLVHPNIENLNEEKLLSRLYERFGQGSNDNRLTSKIWQDAGTFRIKRQIPHASGRGKILPLHILH
jgi:hypothetical protein